MEKFFNLISAIFFGFTSSWGKCWMKKVFIAYFFYVLVFSATAQTTLTQQESERLYKTGLELIERGELGAARETFSRYLATAARQDLRRDEVEYYQAFCAINLYHSDAEKLIGNFVADHSNQPRAASAYYDVANFFYQEKNYPRSSGYFEKADFASLSAEQQNLGRFRWGYSLFSQRKLKEAVNQFDLIKSQGGQYGPAASYYAGYVEYSQGDFDAALTDLKRAEQNQAYAAVVPYLIANVYYKQGKYDELLAYAASIAGRQELTNADEVALLVAEAYFKKSDLKQAADKYEEYLKGHDSNVDKGVLLRAGFSLMSTGKEDHALELLKQSASDKDSVGFYSSYYLGVLYLKRQMKPQALTAFLNARNFKSDPRLVEESSYQAAKIFYDLGQPDPAITELERLSAAYPGSVHAQEVKELLSHAYLNANNYNKAIEYIEAFPKRNPTLDMAYQKATLLKGMELFNKEDYPNAISFFEKSLANPLDQGIVAEASFWSGEACSILRRYEQATEHYQKVLASNQADLIIKARYGLGYAYYNLQQYDRALFSFREFVNKAPQTGSNYGDGVVRLADCYYVTKAYPDALAFYRKAFSSNTTDKDYAHLQAGTVLSIQRKYPEAAAELDLVIRNFQQSRYLDEAMFQRAQIDFEQGSYAASVAGFSRLISAQKSSRFLPYAYMRRAASYYNLKDYQKTADDYIFVLEQFPSHPVTNDVMLPLQEALNLAGKPAEFDKYLTAFKKANPDAKGIESLEFETAKNLYFNQEYQKAVESLQRYAATYPESSRLTEANYYQAESFYRLKDFSRALAIYHQTEADQGFSMTNKVIARVAELEFKLGNYEKAVPAYHRLARIATTKREQFNAWSGLMESHYLLAQYDSTSFYAQQILQNGNVNAGAQNKATLYLGKAAMAKGDYEGAKDEFLNTLNTARDEYGAEAKYLLAQIFYLTKDHKQCTETLFGLNREFTAYTDWVGKSYLLLADNYLAMGDVFQAKGTLKSLVDNFPLESVKNEAKGRLLKIEADELSKQQPAKKDSTGN